MSSANCAVVAVVWPFAISENFLRTMCFWPLMFSISSLKIVRIFFCYLYQIMTQATHVMTPLSLWFTYSDSF